MFPKRFVFIILLFAIVVVLYHYYLYLQEEHELALRKSKKIQNELTRKHSIYSKSSPFKDKNTDHLKNDRPLILYTYFETNNARENAIFFLEHGLHSYADFIFILNGPTDLEQFIPAGHSNIRYIKRNNTCYDLGSVGETLRADNNKLARAYTRFIILNASVRGPFLPTWSKDCWSDIYLKHVTNDTKLVGMTYDCGTYACFIQSMITATDSIGMNVLLKANPTNMYNRSHDIDTDDVDAASLVGLSKCYNEKNKAVSAEISLSNLMHKFAFKTYALMAAAANNPQYQLVTYVPDVLNENTYFGMNVHPYETLFMKSNRNIEKDVITNLTEWHHNSQYSSWKVCKPTSV